MDIKNIEINEQFARALKLMEDGKTHVFVTGKAGTGKSTLLEYFRATSDKKVVVLAPTGVAAVNVGGQTIHSFFRFKPDITVEKARKTAASARRHKGGELYRKLDTIIIDEVSMVRADLMDSIDQFLRAARGKKALPFGGVKMVFIGDLYQLPPVVTSNERAIFAGHYQSPYFFDSRVFDELELELIELEKIYRQKDEHFIKLLNSIRNNSIDEKGIAILNSRYKPDYEPKDGFYIYLTTINSKASEINNHKLAELPGKARAFRGVTEGDFAENSFPTDLELNLKKGAQIMLLNNDSLGRWVNGTVGKVVNVGGETIEVELADGSVEEVEPYTWELFHYEINSSTHAINTSVVGTFTQLPVRLAWAITIHKSQGKTFDRVIIDFERGTFATGQAYVALSRCRNLEGIVLKYKFKKGHILVDWRIVKFITQFQYRASDRKVPLDEKIKMIREAIDNGGMLKITYLKAQDEKSRRVVRPLEMGEMEYLGKPFLGLKAHCQSRMEERVFRVDRILEIDAV